MLFNSLVFIIIFLPFIAGTYHLFCHRNNPWMAHCVLIIASLCFYASWGGYLHLLVISMLTNFLLGRRMQVSTAKKARDIWLFIGIVFNVSALVYFKYANFLVAQLELDTIRENSLPLGISFFTFQQIAFLFYLRQHADNVPKFSSYSTAVSFFPHLVSGPLLKYENIMSQLEGYTTVIDYKKIWLGLVLFTLGLSKKLLIADPLSPYVTSIFDVPTTIALGGADVWLAAIAYTLQLYFDFSGYSDMAIGIGHLFGLHLPENFRSPYRALNISDFWRRWHITLSMFLKDFLYIPLGGSRNGMLRQLLALFVTMLLGGLWHGAGWTFVVWGAWHGSFLIAWHLTKGVRAEYPIGKFFAWITTMAIVITGWIWFRAMDFSTATRMFKVMLTQPFHLMHSVSSETLLLILVASVIVLLLPTSYAIAQRWLTKVERGAATWSAVLLGIWLTFVISQVGGVTEFLYANF